jgi:hypothetical protein
MGELVRVWTWPSASLTVMQRNAFLVSAHVAGFLAVIHF